MKMLASFLVLFAVAMAPAADPSVEYLSDFPNGRVWEHSQSWGKLGLDAAACHAGFGSPLKIGERAFEKGLGHHADGKITIPLQGAYLSFRAVVGVQWQGGGKGSVRFRVQVDDKQVFEHGPVSDRDPGRAIEIPLTGAESLCLIADSGGDGIGCDMANWAEARLARDPAIPIITVDPPRITFGNEPAPEPMNPCAGGLRLVAAADGPQVLWMGEPLTRALMCLREQEEVAVGSRVNGVTGRLGAEADVILLAGRAEAALSVGESACRRELAKGDRFTLEAKLDAASGNDEIVFAARALDAGTQLRFEGLRIIAGDGSARTADIPFGKIAGGEQIPPPPLPELRPGMAGELIEWDWRMHDGIGTPRESVSWSEAIAGILAAGDRLLEDLDRRGGGFGLASPRRDFVGVRNSAREHSLRGEWEECRRSYDTMTDGAGDREWEDLWRRVHEIRRRIVFSDPVVPRDPILFIKQAPSSFSHQLTQYYADRARPGGGVFVLEAPGEDMRCRQLVADQLPSGSYQHPELSYDGKRVLFAFCAIDPARTRTVAGRTFPDAHYHLFETGVAGGGLRQITEGSFDDFAPVYLPGGGILFSSTRRGGFHRCGRGPCPVYTLAKVDREGANLRVLSFHETHEWDPAVLGDGRIVYTRWDYVDRHAVYYQQLWTTYPDGTAPAEYFGNYTRNPVGIWEAKPIPGSAQIMATAAAHHAMTAGSIIRVDVSRGRNTMDAITRLTPDVPFPESESAVMPGRNGEEGKGWSAGAGIEKPRPVPREAKRWPGHCYRSPWPLSENTFLAAYSYDPLIGEPGANYANMFGLYLVDSFGNRELLYRDPNISSLWPIPVRPRPEPPAIPSALDPAAAPVGTFVVRNVYRANPPLPPGDENRVERLRIVQVLPKTTPHANDPRVGWANASPGKQVLGTVPVEPDGSAHFRAPARIPLLFQALDRRGRSMQSMRSLTYLQPGETRHCIGCHEPQSSVPPVTDAASILALQRPPSEIVPGPDGSNPMSYPLLVQPVLDRHCVECHRGPRAGGGVSLTAQPEKEFTESYNQLCRYVSFSAWGRADNSEPLSRPGHFGARGSALGKFLSPGHYGVHLTDQEWSRMITWMDANALFFGTFHPADQERQRRSEGIAGPDLE